MEYGNKDENQNTTTKKKLMNIYLSPHHSPNVLVEEVKDICTSPETQDCSASRDKLQIVKGVSGVLSLSGRAEQYSLNDGEHSSDDGLDQITCNLDNLMTTHENSSPDSEEEEEEEEDDDEDDIDDDDEEDEEEEESLEQYQQTTELNKCNVPVGAPLGNGSSASVHVIYLLDGSLLAVKIMKKNPYSEQAFKKEVSILNYLQGHPNIIPYKGCKETVNDLRIYMRFFPKSLGGVLRECKRIGVTAVRNYAKQLLKACHHCHNRSIIHCDLKPDNIMLSEDGRIALADFGSAIHLTNDKFPHSNNYEGSPAYAAPECTVSGHKANEKIDIWSIGCTIFELLAGKTYLEYQEEKVLDLSSLHSFLKRVYQGQTTVVIPEKIGKTVIKGQCRDFLLKCFTVNPQSRPSCSDLLNHDFIDSIRDRAHAKKRSRQQEGGISSHVDDYDKDVIHFDETERTDDVIEKQDFQLPCDQYSTHEDSDPKKKKQRL